MLGVRHKTLADYGAVSEPVAREMAEGALRQSQADIAISVSGIAGPGGSEFKPEGRVCFAMASAHGTQSETQDFGALGRAAVRQAALSCLKLNPCASQLSPLIKPGALFSPKIYANFE